MRKLHTYLRGNTMLNEMLQKFFILMCQNIFNMTQNIYWRVGKVLKPVLAVVD